MIRILVITLLLISSHVSALTIDWIPPGTAKKSGDPLHINGNAVVEYKNVGYGGIESKTSGDGPGRGELGIRETSQITTTFPAASNRIGFVTARDHNDGFARFFVDDIDMGTYDRYQTGNRILMVTGPDSLVHSLRVMQLGPHNPNSTRGDAAIFGGVAFNTLAAAIPEPETYAMLLAGLGLLSLVACQKKRNV
ncbi:MAG: PEP-CTERM sorting domain-containing protein [Nitrosomonas ureae]